MQSKFISGLRRFANDRGGSIAIIFGLSVMALFTVIGVALDASRAYNINSRVQSVLDAAALAGARTMSLDDANNSQVTETALSHFSAHQGQFKIWGAVPSNPRVTIDRPNAAVTMEVDIAMSSIAGSLSGLLPSMDFSPSSTARYIVKRIELAMVLDVTGSMSWAGGDGRSKLEGLKEAAEDIIKTLSNSTTAPGLIRIGLVPYAASVNAGSYFNDVTYQSRGDTCVVERDGPDAFNDNPVGHGSHIEIVKDPVPFYYSCPPDEVVPLTDIADTSQRNQLIDKVKALTAIGGTAGHIGAAWGWYMVSPKWTGLWPTASDPKPYEPNVTKAVLLMTDGDFNSAYENGGSALSSAARTDVAAEGSSPNQAKKYCDNMKAAGVKVYSVAFMAPLAAESLLRDCSGIENYYDASNTAELKAAFRAIADKLTSLKLSQ